MKKSIFFALALLLSSLAFGQDTKNLKVITNSKHLIEIGNELTGKGQYDEALAQYNKIPLGDLYYYHAQYEKAYVLEITKDYHGAIRIAKELLDDPNCNVSTAELYTLLGNSYDYLKQTDESLAAYDKAIKHTPYNYNLYFNKGVTLMQANRYEEALECFKQSIFLNPSHQGSHYRYGMCYIKLGYTVPGLLALNFCTLINPESGYAIEALREMDAIYSNGVRLYNEDNKIEVAPKYEVLNEHYDKITKVLNTTFTSLKQFHNLSKIDHRIVRSNQIVFNNIEVRPGSHEIEDMLYAPLFSSIMKENRFNTFSYFQFSGTDLDNGKVQAKAAKMQSQFNVLIQAIIQQFKVSTAAGLGIENKEGYTYLYDDNDNLFTYGKVEKGSNGEDMKEGCWYEISNGQLGTIANYKHNELDGLVQILENGIVNQEATFKDGQISGKVYSYVIDHFTSEKKTKSVYESKNHVYEGMYQEYSEAGTLSMDATAKNNGLDGEVKYYNEQGQLTGIEHYVDNEQQGSFKYYYDNGKLSTEYIVGAKNERNNYTQYYPDGRIKTEGQIMNGNKVGIWRTYDHRGDLLSQEEYDDSGEYHGTCMQYAGKHVSSRMRFEHGSTEEITHYGISTGKPLVNEQYKSGQLVSVTTFNPDSTVRETLNFKGKTLTYDVYGEYGHKKATYTVNSKGEMTGKQIMYAANGNISSEFNIKDKKMSGVNKVYYPNGKLHQYNNYRNDMRNGLCVEYFNDEGNSISSEAFYRNDTIIGAYYKYYANGVIEQLEIYDQSGNVLRHTEYYANGTMSSDVICRNGLPLIRRQYTLTGEVLHIDTLHFGSGSWCDYFQNGNVLLSSQRSAGRINGKIVTYGIDQQPLDSCLIINHKLEGARRHYNVFGGIQNERNFMDGCTYGLQTDYDLSGAKSNEFYTENDVITGISKHYNLISGTVYRENHFVNDEREGQSIIYAPDGKTVLIIFYYDHNERVAYSYSQPNGTMSERTLLGNQAFTLTAYYPNGAVGAILNIDKGLLNGASTYYYPNGQAHETWTLVDELYEGAHIIYYPNGKIFTKEEYKNDLLHGVSQRYYDNGQLMIDGNYYYGEYHGDFNFYDKKGNVQKRCKFVYGEQVE